MASSPDPLDTAIPVGSSSTSTPPPPSQYVPPSTPPPAAPPPSPPPPPAPPAGHALPSGTEKIWAILSHVSGFIGVPFILPLVVYFAMKDESAYVGANAKEALNFHLSIFLYTLCLLPLVWLLIGIPLLVALGVGVLVLSIIAAIKSSEGQVYRYPLTIRLVS